MYGLKAATGHRSIGVLTHKFVALPERSRPDGSAGQSDHHHVEMLAYFLGEMQAAKDGDGTLLDHSMLVYGSAAGDPNRRLHNNLPVLLTGGVDAVDSGKYVTSAIPRHSHDQSVSDDA